MPALDEVAVPAKVTGQLGVASTSGEGAVTAEPNTLRLTLRPSL